MHQKPDPKPILLFPQQPGDRQALAAALAAAALAVAQGRILESHTKKAA
jgi:hypothetical protein